MKIKKNLLLAGIIAFTSTGILAAQEKDSTPQTELESYTTNSPIIVSSGKITLTTTHLDGTKTSETIDLTGMDLIEVKRLLGRKQGEAYANDKEHYKDKEYYKERGKRKREYNKRKGEYYRNLHN